jgi:hypothetical protein
MALRYATLFSYDLTKNALNLLNYNVSDVQCSLTSIKPFTGITVYLTIKSPIEPNVKKLLEDALATTGKLTIYRYYWSKEILELQIDFYLDDSKFNILDTSLDIHIASFILNTITRTTRKRKSSSNSETTIKLVKFEKCVICQDNCQDKLSCCLSACHVYCFDGWCDALIQHNKKQSCPCCRFENVFVVTTKKTK